MTTVKFGVIVGEYGFNFITLLFLYFCLH